jgi:hypothetical protein
MSTRTRRGLSVLALLVGLLAMHGLHHEQTAMGGMADHEHTALSSALDGHAVLTPADDGGHALGTVCLAVLTAGSLALLLARTCGARPARSTPLLTRRQPPTAHPRGPPPDLLQLCISRT